MPNTRTNRKSGETIYDKAQRILADPTRVITSPGSNAPAWWSGLVVGDHGTYQVVAISPEMKELHNLPGRLTCNQCPAARRGILCSHAVVGEEMRLRGEDE